MPAEREPPIAAPGRVAILAGGGKLPLMIAESVRRRGGTPHIVAIEGEADATVEAYPHTWVNYGQAAKMMRALKGDAPGGPENTMVIAGAVTRPDIARIRPDMGLFRLLPQVLKFITAGGDDALLTRIIKLYEAQGLHVSGVHEVAPELLMPTGPLGTLTLDDASRADAAKGTALLEALGDLDVGQGVVVVGGKVVAIEGVEGTDRMLARAASLREHETTRTGVFVKRPKPKQERRVDLPTIGPRTIEGAKAAKLAAISVAPGETLVLDRDEATAAADQAGMAVVAEQTVLTAASGAAQQTDWIITSQGSKRPSAPDLDDARRGIAAVSRIARFGVETPAAAVVRGHVVAVAAAEGPAGLVKRLRTSQQWGLAKLTGRRGMLVVRRDLAEPKSAAELAVIVETLARTRFAGIVFWQSASSSGSIDSAVVDRLKAAGLCAVTASGPP